VIKSIWGWAKRLWRASKRLGALDPDEIPQLTRTQARAWAVGIMASVAALATVRISLGVSEHLVTVSGGVAVLTALTWVDRRSSRRDSRTPSA
jgi:hypothetical protein